MLRILKWRDNPRLSQWVNVFTSIFIREREKVRLSNRDVTVEAEVSERFEDATPQVWKIEEGATRERMSEPLSSVQSSHSVMSDSL